MTYKPNNRVAEILNKAMALIVSVPYSVPGRWVFYQLVQRYGLPKSDYKNFKAWTSRARKDFWNGWTPTTMYDSIRSAIIRGVPEPARPAEPDRTREQNYYVELWFEARSMFDQFWYYTEDYYVTLVPFMGDASIPFKWEMAKRLEKRHRTYGKPIVILYFGDCDPKGEMIPKSALKDIRAWCSAPFKFIRCGLTPGQAKQYGLPENPEKPGYYQWEALEDKLASKIILDNLKKFWKKPASKGP